MATKNGTAAKIAAAVVLALGIPAGGVIGFAKLQSDVEWACKQHAALEARHAHDVDAIEGKFTALKASLDALARQGASAQTKLDMLVEMVRDHVRSNGGGSD